MEVQTATAPALTGFLGQRKEVRKDNPHAERFAYMPGVYKAKSDPLKTGYAEFEQGVLLGFITFTRGGLYNPKAFDSSREPFGMMGEVTAADALFNAQLDYQAAEEFDCGFQPLVSVLGRDDAQVYFNALHPTFDQIGHACPFGLIVCPTCRLEWFESEACSEWTARAIEQSGLDTVVLLVLKTELVESCQRYKGFAEYAWNDCAQKQELAKSSGNTFIIDKGMKHWKNCIHEFTTDEKEMQKIQLMTAANAESFQKAFKGNGEVESLKSELAELRGMITNGKNPGVIADREGKCTETSATTGKLCGHDALEGLDRCGIHKEK